MNLKDQKTDNFSSKNGIPSESEMRENWENYSEFKDDFPKPDLESVWNKTSEELGWNKKNGISRISFFRYAAAVLLPILIIGSGIYFTYQKINNSLNYITLESPAGERTKVDLPDGSSIWLQPKSKIRYPKKFKANAREIEFSGQGYFDIQKNADSPFTVHLENMNISVLGTQFYVKSKLDQDIIETGLISGSIKFSGSKVDKLLVPNDVIVYSRKIQNIIENKNLADNSFKWSNENIVFENCEFKKVLNEISDWYNVDIELSQELELNKKITITIRDESIDEILEVLKIIVPFDFKKKQDKIILNALS